MSDMPPVIAQQSNDQYALPEDFNYPERKVTLTQTQELAKRGMPQKAIYSFVGSPSEIEYGGRQLVNVNNNIVRDRYNPDDEAYPELARITSKAERDNLLQTLYDRGFYPSSTKPSATGFESRDLAAMSQLLRTSNEYGRTWDVARTMVVKDYPGGQGGGGGGSGPRYTPRKDIRAVYKEVTRNLLGREPDDKDLDRFVKAYQGEEASAQAASQSATSLQTAAESAVETGYAGERQNVGFLQLAQTFEQMLRGS